MHGEEAACQIRELEIQAGRPPVPILALSGKILKILKSQLATQLTTYNHDMADFPEFLPYTTNTYWRY